MRVFPSEFSSETKDNLRFIILGQCLGMSAQLLFRNGFLYSYLSEFTESRSLTLILLSMPEIMVVVTLLFLAWTCDRVGWKRQCGLGFTVMAIGFLVMTLAGLLASWALPILVLGIILYSVGMATHLSVWMLFLRPLIPEGYRDPFTYTISPVLMRLDGLFAISESRPLE